MALTFFQLCIVLSLKTPTETNPSKVSPVQQVGQSLSSVPLDDPLAPGLLAKAKHELGQLVAGLLWGFEPAVHNVDTWE